MKRLSLKQLLVMVFVGLLTMSGAAIGETNCQGQCGGMCGDGEQHQYGRDDVIGVFETHCQGQCGGQCGEGEQHQYGRDDVSLEGEGICGGGCDHNQYHWAGDKPE